jgi:hypothetical protein
VLSDRNQTWFIHDWMMGSGTNKVEWTVLHAPLREAEEGGPANRQRKRRKSAAQA